MKDLTKNIKPLDTDEIYGKRTKTYKNWRRAEEVNDLKLDGLKFYNLQELTIEDLSFPWCLPKSEMRGCAVYEFYRSRVAIWLESNTEKSQNYSTIFINWQKSLSKSWLHLDTKFKKTFIDTFTGKTLMPCKEYQMNMIDPWPNRRGELFLFKLDLSMPDTELKQMFARSLKNLPPFKGRSNIIHEPSIIADLEGIAAHRMFRCCGNLEPWKFVLKINAKIGGKPNGNSIFSRQDLFQSAVNRFTKRVSAISFAVSQDGSFKFR
jgi:hypothetical protein